VFGINGWRERNLRQHGRAAMATALSIRRKRWSGYQIPDAAVNPNSAGREYKTLWGMAVRVDPDGGPRSTPRSTRGMVSGADH